MADVLDTLIVKLALDAQNYSDGVTNAQRSLASFGSNTLTLGKSLQTGISDPILQIGTAAIDAASDLNESMSKVSVVFGDNATAIQTWSESSATALGQSQQGALEAAGTFGNLFSAMGLGQKETVDMSKGVIQLASDLASFNNISPEVALEKLRAGLVGEAEPLRTLGVNLSAAAIETQAVAMGLAKQGDELTTAQKAQASYALILAQTTAAQGDFTRTSDGLANQQRIMQAELADTTATLGKELLPVALEVATGLKGLLDWFRDLSPETKHWIVIIAGAAAAIGPVLVVLGTMAGAISTIIGVATAAAPVIAAIGAGIAALALPITLIVGAIALLALAWTTDFGGIQEKTAAFWDWLKTSVPSALGSVQGAWSTFSNFWQSDNQTKIATIQAGWSSFVSNWQSQLSGAFATVKGYWQTHSQDVQNIQTSQWGIVNGIIQTAATGIKGIVQIGLDAMKGDWSAVSTDIQNLATALWGNVQGIFQSGLNLITGLFDLAGFHDLGQNIVQGIAEGITNSLSWIESAAREAAQSALDAAKSWLGIGSPSRVAALELGRPFTQGMSIGAEQGIPKATDRIQSALNRMTSDLSLPSPTVGAGGGTGPITINIYAGDRDTANQARLGILDGLRAAGLA